MPFTPLLQVRQFLALTDSQLAAIVQNNSDYNSFSSQQQRQIRNAQTQIAVETTKDSLDPMAIGALYAGIESACRDLRNKAAATQKQNISILTDAQKAKLNTLNDAMKLAPVISEAQSGKLLGSAGSPPFTIGPFFDELLGPVNFLPFALSSSLLSTVPGCGVNGIPTAAFRSGDFSSVPSVNGNTTQPGGNPKAWPDPLNGLFVGNSNTRLSASPNKWFTKMQP